MGWSLATLLRQPRRLPRTPAERIGEVFGRLTIVAVEDAAQKLVLCRCACGGMKTARVTNLLRGKTSSCGCVHREHVSQARRRHGMAGTPTYQAWLRMRDYCSNRKNPLYAKYGGVGIRVCPRWQESFEAFLADMGPSPCKGAGIQRSSETAPYAPETCRWTTQSKQVRGKARLFPFNGSDQTLQEICAKLGLKYHTVLKRYQAGDPLEQMLRPPRKGYNPSRHIPKVIT